MKMRPLLYLLTAGMVATNMGAYADPAAVKPDPLPDHWFKMYHTPKFDAFYMNGQGLPDPPGFIMWNKIVFNAPQPSPSGEYQQRILELAIDCKAYRYAVLRDLEYAADGKVLRDSSAPQFVRYTAAKASDDPVINSYVLDDDDVGCHRGE